MKKVFILILIVIMGAICVYSSDDYGEKIKNGLTMLNEGDYEAATGIFNGIIETTEYCPEALCALAVINISLNDFNKAREYILRTIEQNNKYPQSYYLLGLIDEQLDNFSSALKNYEKYLTFKTDTKYMTKVNKRIMYLKEKLEK